MLKDLDSGRILFSRGADKRFAPASMAKVMTAYVVIDLIEKGELSRDKLFKVEDATWKLWSARHGESTMFLRAGENGGVTKVSAGDLILLADRLIRDHPRAYARYFSIPKFQHGMSPDGKPIIQSNRNPILGRFVGADGLKTGHTSEAGYCFLGSAKRDGRRLIMVVAGLPSDKARREEAERLMNWGFANKSMSVAAQNRHGGMPKGRTNAAGAR